MKKALITILIILIIGSTGVIGYFIYNQNKTTLRPVVGEGENTDPLFPVATTTGVSVGNASGTEVTLGQIQNHALGVPNRPELSQMSLAGLATAFIGKELKTLFVEKGTGNIYSLDSQNNMTRLSNTTIPSLEVSYLGSDSSGWRAILGQEKNSQAFNYLGQMRASAATNTDPSELKITTWINPLAVAVAPNGDKIVYLEKQKDGNANLYQSDWSIKNSKKIWSSPLAEWSVDWPKDNIVTVTSRASFDYPGIIYSINLSTGQSKRILGEINGLTSKTSPGNQRMIYSKSLLGGVSLYQYDLATGTSRLLEINTLPDKCAWFNDDILYCAVPKNISNGRYPDDWYSGRARFSDDIWRLDLKQKTNTLVYSLKGSYDLGNLVINRQTGWLYAINRGDNALQAFSLKP